MTPEEILARVRELYRALQRETYVTNGKNQKGVSLLRSHHWVDSMSLLARLRAVVRLFLDGRPANVSRLVVSVVVDSIEAVIPRRFKSNVTKERRKRSIPFVADTNAASSVATEPIVIGILTSASHAAPRAVFGGRPTARMSVLPRSGDRHFNGETIARFGVAVDEVRPTDDRFSAARAETLPKRMLVSAQILNLMQDSQASECLASYRVSGSPFFTLNDVRAVVRAEPHAFVSALKWLTATVSLAGELIHGVSVPPAVLTPSTKAVA